MEMWLDVSASSTDYRCLSGMKANCQIRMTEFNAATYQAVGVRWDIPGKSSPHLPWIRPLPRNNPATALEPISDLNEASRWSCRDGFLSLSAFDGGQWPQNLFVMYASPILLVLYCIRVISAQTGFDGPLAQACSPSLPNVVCLNKYASVMPYHFYRNISNGTSGPTFGSTSVPNDTSFALVNEADFLVFDCERASEVLGPSPTYDFIFDVSEAVHETPVYVASQNKLYLSQLAPPPGYLPQLVVDLNQDPPTLSEYLSDLPVYAPNGGTFHHGLIYWGASGGNNSIGGTEQRVGLRTLDPTNNKSTTILNNYFGYYFNTVDDLFVHPNGDVWFTDPDYSWFNQLTDTLPQLEAATYRFRPSTGAVHIVEDTLEQPNGIAISPDTRTIYISDTGAVRAPISPFLPAQPATFNATGKRTVYAFDLSADATYLTNKRPFYLSHDWVPDGLKVARNGYVVTATGKGVDVLSEQGEVLLRVQTNYTVQNFAWVGEELGSFR